MSLYRVIAMIALGFIALGSKETRAAFVLSLDASQLNVQATGGIVNQAVDLFITHDGIGLNTFSDYELRIQPASSAVVVTPGPITVSAFSIDLHSTAGSGPYSVNGVNASNLTVLTGTNQLLARFNLQIDTAVLTSGGVALDLSVFSASRGGIFGTSILNEFSVVPATVNISAVPEPGSGVLLLAALSSTMLLRRKRSQSI